MKRKYLYLLLAYFSISLVHLEAETRSKYFIAIKKNEGDVLHTLDDFIPFLPKKQHLYADPMLFKHQGINYIFFEDYDYHKGIILYTILSEEGNISPPKAALELPIHLSFPFVFSEKDDIFMVPETYDAKEVALFQAIKFPSQWEKRRVLVQGENFADPILFKYNDYYWLFTAVRCDRLRIYYAKNLESKFIPHPINVRNIAGRNAGAVFYDGGHLIRPVMDCSKVYGGSMTLNRIEKLTPKEFREKPIAYIYPTWAQNLDGTHTYNQNEDFVVYDGRRTIDSSQDEEYSEQSIEDN